MSKEEQFEHIENKIKQAIQNNQPVFDEKAWVKMEALLDKDEKKPKTFYWLWFLLPLLLVGGGSAYLSYNYKNTHKNSAENIVKVATDKNNVQSSKKPEIIREQEIAQNISQSPTQKNNEESLANRGLIKERQIAENMLSQKSNQPLKEITSGKQSKIIKSKTKVTGIRENIVINNAGITENNNPYNYNRKIQITDDAKAKIKTTESKPVDDATIIEKKGEDKNVAADIKGNDTKSALVIAKNETKADIVNPDKKNKQIQAKKKQSPFYLLGSFGADIGSVKLFSFNNSSLAAKYGIGIGYQLNNKWSLQTGFYSAKKKYIAGPNDYHPKRTLPNYIKIIKVNAECVVYEIPLTIRYDILRKSSISYYTAIGLSSYLMKKEDYNFYSTIYDTPNEFDTTYSGNKHLFSNLTISAGVEKKISKSLSLQLEPSVSLPLSGVGYGKVKLFSTAIMLGVKYLPFKKRK